MKEVERLIELLLKAKDNKIFIVGMGRSGFVGREFAVCLMNPGFEVYFLCETITPATEEDLPIVISRTGATKTVLTANTAAKEIGATVVAVTSFPESPLDEIADHAVTIERRTKMGWPREEDYLARQLVGQHEPLTPLRDILENHCMVFSDGLIVDLMHRLGRTEEDLKRRHATVE